MQRPPRAPSDPHPAPLRACPRASCLCTPAPHACALTRLPPCAPSCSDKEDIFKFATDAANHIVEAYVPIIKKHKNDPYSPRQKEWQQIRRGR